LRYRAAQAVAGLWLVLLSPAWGREPLWLSPAEISRLPTSGEAWRQVLAAADDDCGRPNLADQDQDHNVLILAKALVYARTGQPAYRQQVIEQCLAAIGTERSGRALALGRELCAYVISADLVGWNDPRFAQWLRDCRQVALDGPTLVEAHEDRPNNWGLHCGASRLAVAMYLDDQPEIDRCATIFRGWLGDRQAYAGFRYRDLSWQADPEAPVGINPAGSKIEGFLVDGALPEEMRRGGRFRVPPVETNYPWGALQGAFVQAELLHRRGHKAYDWEDQALLRAVRFLMRQGWQARGDDEWILWLANRRYGTHFASEAPPRRGKNMAWTNWTHP
jgi:hypothetical protein